MSRREEIERARTALHALDPGCCREEWVRYGMAAKAAGLTFEDFHAWSNAAPNYQSERDCRLAWESFGEGDVTVGTLFYAARSAVLQDASGGVHRSAIGVIRVTAPESQGPVPALAPAALAHTFNRYPPADGSHAYLVAKRGPADGLRVVPEDDPRTIIGRPVAGYLAVPVRSLDGELLTVQYIPAPGMGDKLNAPGASFGNGLFMVNELMAEGRIYVCEGVGHAWALARADPNAAAAVAFGCSRFPAVGRVLRERFPDARLVFVADRGKEAKAAEIAREMKAAWVEMPPEKPDNYDANDYEAEHGTDALARRLQDLRWPQSKLALNVAFADALPAQFRPPDELVEGVLTAGGGSVLYGDSNSGKTFFAIDMAAAVARGVPWMGRQTDQGLVVYLATESPASVRGRLQAYQAHHGERIPNFAIVESPIDLFGGDEDTDHIIELVQRLESERGQQVSLIVGDTLARLSAGANENAGQDMGLVVRRFDRVRAETGAHFLLIHHCGKNAAAGMRGWSGLPAAVDTEIEIVESKGGRYARIRKQRDLPTKGEQIGFRLETVEIGQTKWGARATSCIVVPAPASGTATSKRFGSVEEAVLELLASKSEPVAKSAVVGHFKGRYEKGPVYRAMKTLTAATMIGEINGLVSLTSNNV